MHLLIPLNIDQFLQLFLQYLIQHFQTLDTLSTHEEEEEEEEKKTEGKWKKTSIISNSLVRT